ncbi:MAG: transketolase, partial [Calditrichaeota bacterium]
MIALKDKIITLKYITLTAEEILQDYRLAFKSREASLLGRKEVMGGRAKFGIFGDGKEIPQLAMAKAFQKGDFRSGYYRDQTVMFALGEHTISEFFAQLYAHADLEAEPATGGRQMNCHFATRFLNPDGTWKNLTEHYNSSADLSPTASQMSRLVGLAYASRLYRELEELKTFVQFSKNGNEVAFGTIGNASCAEGMFWEAINAIGVLHAPAVLAIWDDDYGISVPNEYQITKGNISEVLKGFQRKKNSRDGFDIYTVKGWDYPALVDVFLKAATVAREKHIPAIIHVTELTQPQGHSTSGSHERYKSRERLEWEKAFDGIRKMREWMIAEGIVEEDMLNEIEEEDRKEVERIRDKAWEAYQKPIRMEINEVVDLISSLETISSHASELRQIREKLTRILAPTRKDIFIAVRQALVAVRSEESKERQNLIEWKRQHEKENHQRYDSYLYSQSHESALKVPEVKP